MFIYDPVKLIAEIKQLELLVDSNVYQEKNSQLSSYVANALVNFDTK